MKTYQRTEGSWILGCDSFPGGKKHGLSNTILGFFRLWGERINGLRSQWQQRLYVLEMALCLFLLEMLRLVSCLSSNPSFLRLQPLFLEKTIFPTPTPHPTSGNSGFGCFHFKSVGSPGILLSTNVIQT